MLHRDLEPPTKYCIWLHDVIFEVRSVRRRSWRNDEDHEKNE